MHVSNLEVAKVLTRVRKKKKKIPKWKFRIVIHQKIHVHKSQLEVFWYFIPTTNINTSTYATQNHQPTTTTTQIEYSVYCKIYVDEKYTTPCTGTAA